MLQVTTDILEVRGYELRTSKKGNTYYNLNCEDVSTGEAFKFYITENLESFGIKKGDLIRLSMSYNFRFKDLRVICVIPETEVLD